jgi:hypothetical protein
MPPRKPTTRRSLRASKLKELEFEEVSSPRTSPAAAKQLEFYPRLEPVIRTSTKKVFTQPLTFRDMEESIGTNTTLHHWGELFKKISWQEFLEYIPYNDPDMRKLDDEVFSNI